MTNTPQPIIEINPPPDNLCCERCGRHISKVKSFKDGSKLMKNFRCKYRNTDNEYLEASWECVDCIWIEDDDDDDDD